MRGVCACVTFSNTKLTTPNTTKHGTSCFNEHSGYDKEEEAKEEEEEEEKEEVEVKEVEEEVEDNNE